MHFPADRRYLHSFPTRRSSDLEGRPALTDLEVAEGFDRVDVLRLVASVEPSSEHPIARAIVEAAEAEADRKSTRLNSSHVAISYAVFCVTKKPMLSCYNGDYHV